VWGVGAGAGARVEGEWACGVWGWGAGGRRQVVEGVEGGGQVREVGERTCSVSACRTATLMVSDCSRPSAGQGAATRAAARSKGWSPVGPPEHQPFRSRLCRQMRGQGLDGPMAMWPKESVAVWAHFSWHTLGHRAPPLPLASVVSNFSEIFV
jgi:hypothetical protein